MNATRATRAGFARIDITPPLGTELQGWIRRVVAERILDPLQAGIAVIEGDGGRCAFIQLDVSFVPWHLVAAVRQRIAAVHDFPPDAVMIAGTHNHAGPVLRNRGECTRDEAYVQALIERLVDGFGQALAASRPARIGQGSGFNFDIAHNRRVVMRDGTVRTHGKFSDPGSMYLEGPIDPEVAVLAAKDMDGRPLGVIVNFACHPTHHGSGGNLSGGFPGAMARRMMADGWPVALFLNGAAGNLHTADPTRDGRGASANEAGERLAQTAEAVLAALTYDEALAVTVDRRTVQLPFRPIEQAEIDGTVSGAQRFVDPKLYDKQMPELVAWMREQRQQKAELQAFALGERVYVSVPGELFVQLGFQIKEGCHPKHALIVGYANGSIGYIPHREGYARGGYETTLGWGKVLAPGAGEQLAQYAIDLVTGLSGSPPRAGVVSRVS